MYLLFAGFHYYPSGGWDDFIGSFDSVQACLDALKSICAQKTHYEDWYQIVDMNTQRVVIYGNCADVCGDTNTTL